MTCSSCGSSNLTDHAVWHAAGHETGWLLCGDCGNRQRREVAVEAPAAPEPEPEPDPEPRRRRRMGGD